MLVPVTTGGTRADVHPIRRHRCRKGWSQTEFGGLVGRSQPYVSLVEQWKREPSPDLKITFARVLGVPVEDLFTPVSNNGGRS
jgi:DNA-binding XRE family transcriptional regulator